MTVDGFSERWKNFPDYILGITQEIWEGRGIGTLNHYYAPDLHVRTPMGVQSGNQAVIAATMSTLHEFPDRELLGEDVIWSGDAETGFLSSHRILSTGTHSSDGVFGPASGKKFKVRTIADCAAKADCIFDEWMIRDYGGIVRQLGGDPRNFAASLIESEGGASNCAVPLTPETDPPLKYIGNGNENEWGARYATTLQRMMDKDFNVIVSDYDRAVRCDYPGGQSGHSHAFATEFWLGLRSAFPNAEFKIHHQIGMDADMLSPRAAIRWSLHGKHEGHGAFGRPTGAEVFVMGMCHAEFGPYGEDGASIRYECALYDEVAIWKQILMQTGESS